MNAEALIDSNILLYAVSTHPSEQKKRQQARALLVAPGIGFSTQVFSEFYDNATRKQEPRLTPAQAAAILDPLRSLPVQPITSEIVWDAIRLSQRFQLRLWDALILAAARALGCRIVWSEDLNHGQQYDGVRVQDPFRPI